MSGEPCDTCGRPTPHLAHAYSNDSLKPANPPFGRTLADEKARPCPSVNCSGKPDQCSQGKCPRGYT